MPLNLTNLFYFNPQYIRKNSHYHLTSGSNGTFRFLSHFINNIQKYEQKDSENNFMTNYNKNLNTAIPLYHVNFGIEA